MHTRTDFNATGSPQVHTSTIFTVALSVWNNTEVEIVLSWQTIERTNKEHLTESREMETKLSITKKNWVKRKPWSNKLPERRPFEIKKIKNEKRSS